ncbi:MAG: FAD-dependent oxidoreductase [unclassified Hahellaceae]|nr:FAD-dependent oxidoreductase [Hahellaceae bacterium]|tara:strand:+ start:12692 stop:13993 length:1302 start_codon:yes stop_codon:yes gene_type:complete
MDCPRIVVVGGGAGGLELVRKLARRLGKKGKADIHLVDAQLTHLWKPLLHEVATGRLDANIDELDYRAHAFLNNYRFHLGRVCSVDTANRYVCLAAIKDAEGQVLQPARNLPYDYLVLAVGSRTNDFGTPGVMEHCSQLDSREQADAFHEHLVNTFLRLNSHADAGEPPILKVGIVGGGATGVELAAELHNTTALLRAYGLNLGSDNLQVTLIEAGPRILPALPERITDAVLRELSELKIDVRHDTAVTRVTAAGFETRDGSFIESDIKVWAAGVKGPQFLSEIESLETNRLNQIVVHQTLQSKSDPNVFAMGDCAECIQDDGSRVPPRAQSAHQMADTVSDNLVRLVEKRPMKNFIYRDHGSLISLSRYSTVGSLMGNLTGKSMMIEGFVARFMYVSLYRMHQAAVYGYLKTLLIMLSSQIDQFIRPKLKLH